MSRSEHVTTVYSTYRGRVVTRPRLADGQYYRVTQISDDGVVRVSRFRIFRSAARLADRAEAAGLTAEITIRREVI